MITLDTSMLTRINEVVDKATSMGKTNKLSKMLATIKTSKDVDVTHVEYFEDDQQPCASFRMNGVHVEALWMDETGFLEYWDESPKAFKKLVTVAVESLDQYIHDEHDFSHVVE
jgi:hypothetical protein